MQISQHALARPYVDVLVKTASGVGAAATATRTVGDVLKHYGTLAVEHGPWLVPAATAGAMGVSSIVDRMTAASRKASVYKNMMDANPHLHEQNSDLVQKYFNVLYTMNPEFAKEPTVAGSFVMNQVFGASTTSPHAMIYEQALKMRGVQGGQKSMGGPTMLGEIGKTIAGMNESFGREKRIDKAIEDLSKREERFADEKKDLQTSVQEKVREMQVKSRMHSMGKAREHSANTKLDRMQQSMQALSDDAARLQYLLDQHGIPHRPY